MARAASKKKAPDGVESFIAEHSEESRALQAVTNDLLTRSEITLDFASLVKAVAEEHLRTWAEQGTAVATVKADGSTVNNFYTDWRFEAERAVVTVGTTQLRFARLLVHVKGST